MLKVDVLVGRGLAGAAFQLLQRGHEELSGAGGDGVEALFGQRLKQNEKSSNHNSIQKPQNKSSK